MTASASTTSSINSEMIIRRLVPSDGPAVKGLVMGILAHEYPGDQEAYPAADLDHPEVSYGSPRDAFFVAVAGGQIVGTCGVKAESPAAGLVRRLFVSAAHRGRGVGSRLLDAVIAHGRAAGFRSLKIRTADRMVAAIAVCRARGFREDERVRFGPIQLIRMTLAL